MKGLEQTLCFDIGSTFHHICYISVAADVKQEAELNIGILTQCVKRRTISLEDSDIYYNILRKMNSKLNGVNHILASVSK
jgi:hypothetical protein